MLPRLRKAAVTRSAWLAITARLENLQNMGTYCGARLFILNTTACPIGRRLGSLPNLGTYCALAGIGAGLLILKTTALANGARLGSLQNLGTYCALAGIGAGLLILSMLRAPHVT